MPIEMQSVFRNRKEGRDSKTYQVFYADLMFAMETA
jgi:hypothetical protein